MTDDTLTHAEAAEYLGITTTALYGLVTYGTITPERVPTAEGAKNYYNFYPLEMLAAYKDQRDAKPYRTELSPADIEIAVKLYESGRSIAFCKKFLNIGQTRLRNILLDHGVKIRVKGPQRGVHD